MRKCKNRYCDDTAAPGIGGLCPSCRYIARWAFALGAFAAGLLARLL